MLTDPYELFELWERGRAEHPVDRALTLVGAAHPGASRSELAAWSLGDRDAALLALHRSSFGPVLEAVGSCPECDAAMEASLPIAALPLDARPALSSGGEVRVGERTIRFRLPNTLDLAAILPARDAEEARTALARRLVEGDAGTLTHEETEALVAAIEEADPLTEIAVELACPDCSHAWVESLDVGAFVWTEVEARAERLLWQVVRLAEAYGWTEEDVLALAPARRAWYLEAAER